MESILLGAVNAIGFLVITLLILSLLWWLFSTLVKAAIQDEMIVTNYTFREMSNRISSLEENLTKKNKRVARSKRK